MKMSRNKISKFKSHYIGQPHRVEKQGQGERERQNETMGKGDARMS